MTKQIDNFLSDADYGALREYVQAQPMLYGSKSNSRTDPHGHWSWKPLHDHRENLADLTNKLPKELSIAWDTIKIPLAIKPSSNPAVIRCYANGYTYGTDGYFHRDSDRNDEQTVIVYICDEWNPDWAGETMWQTDSMFGGYASVMPAPNRALILPSNVMHCARAVSRKCNALRTTLMFKTRPRRDAEFEMASNWLVHRGALEHKHRSGTLHDHLMRVQMLLDAKITNPKLGKTAIMRAGAIHSVYGTNVFHQAIVTPDAAGRSMVAAGFGKEAEALAYMFSVLDRPETLERPHRNTDGTAVLKMRYDHHVTVTAEMLLSLQLIEAANLWDQDSLDRRYPVIRQIWETYAYGA